MDKSAWKLVEIHVGLHEKPWKKISRLPIALKASAV